MIGFNPDDSFWGQQGFYAADRSYWYLMRIDSQTALPTALFLYRQMDTHPVNYMPVRVDETWRIPRDWIGCELFVYDPTRADWVHPAEGGH